jgi:hypothetical protein
MESALRDKEDYRAKRKALDDLGRNKDVDQKAVQQRRLALDKEAKQKGVEEGWKDKVAAVGLAGAMALGASGANARVTPDGQGGYTGGFKPSATATAPSDNKSSAAEAPKGYSKEYLQKAADPNRFGRYMISVEKAQELLKNMSEGSLKELSTEKLAQYKKAAGADAKKADADGDYARGDKRFKGINKATNKQFDNDLKKHGQQGMAERVRDPEDWDEGNTEPPNNFAVSINGKKWKVFQGRGKYADDYREKAHYQQLKDWAAKKSASTGKQWTVSITGEGPTA